MLVWVGQNNRNMLQLQFSLAGKSFLYPFICIHTLTEVYLTLEDEQSCDREGCKLSLYEIVFFL